MRGTIVVLIVFMSAYISSAASSGGEGALSILGSENSGTLATSADMKRIEIRMNEAISSLEAHTRAIGKEGTPGTTKTNPSMLPDNSVELPLASLNSSNMSSINSSAINSTALNSSAIAPFADGGDITASSGSEGEKSSKGALNDNSSEDRAGVGANSRASFKGYYGITASQHEMGKNDIDSRTFLSGTFSMDKSVKFQDRGI